MTSPLPLVERKRRQARERIIRAAEELFLARGFDDVSVGDIAERAEAGQADDAAVPRSASEAVEQLRPIVLALCAQATADPAAYARHYQLVEQHPELRDRDVVKMQQIAEKLSDLLIHRGCGQAIAVLAGQISLACYQTARRLNRDPRNLTDEARAVFGRVLPLGTGSAQA